MTSCPVAQKSLSIDLYPIHGQIGNEVGIIGRTSYECAHIGTNVGLRASGLPHPYIIHATIPPAVASSSAKGKIAKRCQSRVVVARNLAFLQSVDISCHLIAVYHDGHMRPYICTEDACHLHTVACGGIPSGIQLA